MHMKLYPKELRITLKNHTEMILYLRWPPKFRKVRYPDGQSKVAAGAFSHYRSAKERAHAHANWLLWEDEIRRRRIAEGAREDGVAISGGPVPDAPVSSGERQVPDIQA